MKSALATDSVSVPIHYHCQQVLSLSGETWSGLLSYLNELFRGKLRHMKNVKGLFEQKPILLWGHQTRSG